ncbi:MAG: amidohydrolase family protein [Methanotrichaceae archaeon]
MMPSAKEILLSGTIIYGDDFEPVDGYLCIKDDLIREVGVGRVDADFEGIIAPRFINSHTHIGDSVFKDPPFMPLADLVGPGGLKHRILAQTPKETIIDGMRRTLAYMIATGTIAFADFREGGQEGVELMLDALQGMPILPRIFGRPYEGSAEIHSSCWGLGVSSTRDYDPEKIQRIVKAVKAGFKAVAIHAGEAESDDISDALRLEPDFLVHLCSATNESLERIAALGVPAVVCPRSNLITGARLPNVKKMTELGITVGVGTDNAMLNSPNMFSEMELVCKALLHDDRQVFKMCTLNGAKILGIDQKVGSISEGKEGRVMVIDSKSDNIWGSADPLASLVRRAEPSDIIAVF